MAIGEAPLRIKPPFEYVPRAAIFPIEVATVGGQNALHEQRDFGPLRADMIMIRHRTITKDRDSEGRKIFFQEMDEAVGISAASEDILPIYAAPEDMIEMTRMKIAYRPSHNPRTTVLFI